MKKIQFKAAQLAYGVIMVIGLAYVFFLKSNLNPELPSEIKNQVKTKIETEGIRYIESLPLHDPNDLLDSDETYRVTKIKEIDNALLVFYRHKEVKDLLAVLSFGKMGQLETVLSSGLVQFEPVAGVNSVTSLRDSTP